MNGKKAKLMRSVGKVDKKTKRLFNQLSADEKKVLTNFYTFVKTRKISPPNA
jgi:hypothetical protein